MLELIIIALIIAFVAWVVGFRTLAGIAATIAKVLFFIFLVLLLVSVVFSFLRGF